MARYGTVPALPMIGDFSKRRNPLTGFPAVTTTQYHQHEPRPHDHDLTPPTLHPRPDCPPAPLPDSGDRDVDADERIRPFAGEHRGELEGPAVGGAVSGVSAVGRAAEEGLEGVVDR